MSARDDVGEGGMGEGGGGGAATFAGLETSMLVVRWLRMGSPALVCLVHGETALDCVGEFGLACRVR